MILDIKNQPTVELSAVGFLLPVKKQASNLEYITIARQENM